MGPGRFARYGIASDRNARSVFWNSAARLCRWVPASRGRLLDRISALRLARVICRGRFAGVIGDLYPGACPRIAGLATPPGTETARPTRHTRIRQTTWDAFYPRCSAHDGVQLHVAWHAGPLCDIPGEAAWLRHQCKIDDRNHLRDWRDLRRHGHRFSLATMGTSALDHFLCDLWDLFDPGLDFRTASGLPNYALTMALVECVVFVAIIVLAATGREERGKEF